MLNATFECHYKMEYVGNWSSPCPLHEHAAKAQKMKLYFSKHCTMQLLCLTA